eukprot:3627016-Pyramimonas_sp.AAC.1
MPLFQAQYNAAELLTMRDQVSHKVSVLLSRLARFLPSVATKKSFPSADETSPGLPDPHFSRKKPFSPKLLVLARDAFSPRGTLRRTPSYYRW